MLSNTSTSVAMGTLRSFSNHDLGAHCTCNTEAVTRANATPASLRIAVANDARRNRPLDGSPARGFAVPPTGSTDAPIRARIRHGLKPRRRTRVFASPKHAWSPGLNTCHSLNAAARSEGEESRPAGNRTNIKHAKSEP